MKNLTKLTLQSKMLIKSMMISNIVAAVLTIGIYRGAFMSGQLAASDTVIESIVSKELLESAASVVIVAIDDKTVQELGRIGDWPRRYYAQVVDRISDGFARQIVIDVLFAESNADDGMVTDALTRFLNVSPGDMQKAQPTLNRRSVILPIIGIPDREKTAISEVPVVYLRSLSPTQAYLRASSAVGSTLLMPDSDGVVRRSPALVRIGDQVVPSLGLAALVAYHNPDDRAYERARDGSGILAAGRLIPTDEFLNLAIGFGGPPSRADGRRSNVFAVVRFIDVMNGLVEPSLFRDKSVFIGTLDATGVGDEFPVPTSPGHGMMAGVEAQATIFSTIQAGRFFTEQQRWVTAFIVWFFCVVSGLVIYRFKILLSVLIFVAIGVLYTVGALLYCAVAYDPRGIPIPNLFYPPWALLVVFIAEVVFASPNARLFVSYDRNS